MLKNILFISMCFAHIRASAQNTNHTVSIDSHAKIIHEICKTHDGFILFDHPNIIIEALAICGLLNKVDSYERLIEITQKHWIRKAGTERYHIPQHEGEKAKFIQVNSHKLIKDTIPSKNYDAVICMGASGPSIKNKLQFLHSNFDKINSNTIIILHGYRLKSEIDGSEFQNHINEEEISRHLTEKMFGKLDANNQLQYHGKTIIVDGPRKNASKDDLTKRHTTQDTLEYLKNKHTQLMQGNILIVAHSPHVDHQRLVAINVLNNRHIDAIGSPASLTVINKSFFDSLARTIYELYKYHNQHHANDDQTKKL